MKLGTFHRAALVLAGSTAAVAAFAQTANSSDPAPGAAGLNIPQDARFIRDSDPNVRKATIPFRIEVRSGLILAIHRAVRRLRPNRSSGRGSWSTPRADSSPSRRSCRSRWHAGDGGTCARLWRPVPGRRRASPTWRTSPIVCTRASQCLARAAAPVAGGRMQCGQLPAVRSVSSLG